MTDELIDYGRGIYAFDAGYVRPALAAIHLVVDGGRVALIDSGTVRSVPLAIAALSKLGLGPEAVDYLILTHVHLDHAAGAGAMIQALPEARLIVHPRCVRHMADPDQLSKAVAAVYGVQRARSLYGKLRSVPAERILASDLAASLPLGARCLRLFDTPGHARHHLCAHDEESASIFTGDTFGVCYRELDQISEEGVGEARRFVFPTTSPSQFDPVALQESIDATLARRPAALYPTHYGQMRPTAAFVAGLRRMIDEHVKIAVDAADAGRQREIQIRGGAGRPAIARVARLWFERGGRHGAGGYGDGSWPERAGSRLLARQRAGTAIRRRCAVGSGARMSLILNSALEKEGRS